MHLHNGICSHIILQFCALWRRFRYNSLNCSQTKVPQNDSSWLIHTDPNIGIELGVAVHKTVATFVFLWIGTIFIVIVYFIQQFPLPQKQGWLVNYFFSGKPSNVVRLDSFGSSVRRILCPYRDSLCQPGILHGSNLLHYHTDIDALVSGHDCNLGLANATKGGSFTTHWKRGALHLGIFLQWFAQCGQVFHHFRNCKTNPHRLKNLSR